MSKDVPFAPAWYRAATLRERLPAPTAGSGPEPIQHLERWRTDLPFANRATFQRRLALAGLTQDDLLTLLAEAPEALQQRLGPVPDWVEELERAFPASPGDAAEGPFVVHGDTDGHGFLVVVEPLLRQAVNRLQRAAAPYLKPLRGGPLDSVVPMFVSALAPRLLTMVSRTLVLEMNVARLQEELSGETPQERFRSFVTRLRSPSVVRGLFHEYPVLARQVRLALAQGVAYFVELLRHLSEDWSLLTSTFARGGQLGPLVRVEGNVGDRHRSGRAVVILHFKSGLRLVYKPKAMAAEVRFHQLLTWLNECGAEPALRTIRVLDRGQHGWMEFIESEPCHSLEEVRRFYQRQGAYLALLYILVGTDCHHDNVIASGEHPMFIDLDALFHRRLPGLRVDPTRLGLMDGVLAIRLLPQLYFVEGAERPIDFSGVGSTSGQPSPYGAPTWEGNETDEMRWARRPGTLPDARNRPTLDGAAVNPKDYALDLEAGFTSLYQLLRRHKDDLLARLGSFAEDEVRFIARPTQLYSILLNQSFHPDRLRDCLERERFFDRLWLQAADFPGLGPLIEAERAELHQGDVPLFRTRPGSRDVWTSAGERIANFFEVSGLDMSRQRINRLGEDDLVRQQWFIRTTLGLLPGPEATVVRRPAGPASLRRLLTAARRVGDHVRALGWTDGKEAGWAGLIPAGARGWAIGPLRLDLADGLPGVVLFLAYLAKVTGEGSYEALARAGLEGVWRQRMEGPPAEANFRSGLVYLLTHLGSLWNEPDLFREALALAGVSPAERSGCLASLVCLHRATGSAESLAAAVAAADHLVEKGLPYPEEGPVGPGTAAALLELSRLTGPPHFRAAAMTSLQQARARSGERQPGLGFTRAALQVLRYEATPDLDREVQAILATVLRRQAATDHSLGKGEMGWIDLLVDAETILGGRTRWWDEARALAGQVLAGAGASWHCATPSGVEVPGLASGLAGIGYALLRLAEPTSVPSLFSLAPPPASRELRTDNKRSQPCPR
jgi:type 2 lantibiotic biosynthesis protein LanM